MLLLNILEACSGVIDTFIRNMRAEILRTKEAKEALNLCHRQIAEALRNKDNAAGKDALDRHFRMIDEILEKNEKKQEKNVDLSHILFLLFIFCFCNLFPTDILP